MKSKTDKIVITAALPYANGQIHIGHLLEYVQADVYSRFLKMMGKDALYICASDMHGTPIEINAKKAGIAPEKFVEKFWKEHQEDFSNFLIKFDNYYKTHSPENKELAEYFYNELKKKDLIYRKSISSLFCENCARNLPDRFVKGTCPNCTTLDQYGDICENCGSILKGVDLINPKCVECGRTPIQKDGEHYFFKLGNFAKDLKHWFTKEKTIQPEVKNWLQGWLDKGLEDWCVSRDEPYFGFEIPDSVAETGSKKYFYVWLDAPIGYISSTKNYCDKQIPKQDWKDYWYNGQVYHFIGKDIAYFHYLFWPAMLMGVGIPLPKLTTHGFITVNGEKMSKSRGTFFTAKDFLRLYSAESLRFYYSSHLDRKVIDVDINFEDFMAVNNNVLAANLGNYCYRVLTFAQKNYGQIEVVANHPEQEKLVMTLVDEIKNYYEQMDFKNAVKCILKVADLGNAYFQQAEVWKDKDSVESKAKVSFCVNLSKDLAILINPILPQFSEKVYTALNLKHVTWQMLNKKWKGTLKPVEMLVQKIESLPQSSTFPLKLVVGQIKEVRDHPNADSLYLLKVDLGSFGTRQVVAGLKKHLDKEILLNRKAVFCVNLKPAKLRGELSEAMVLAADDHESVAILDLEKSLVGDEVTFHGLQNSDKEVTFDDFQKLLIVVKGGNVYFDDKKLSSKVEDVKVIGVKEGTRIF
ncbi:methionine--tRNA ligase [Candidatus Woesearchaeota archaeon CG_4_10_14_0_2_um_filter_33_13]|nr:MAG: methionine--tRNA ligase [Candidatus Woesearchaeota archaeon CG_4_10_14_0_2_um_filter_33_13]